MTQVEKGPWVIPQQLRRARESLGLPLHEAARRANVGPGDLERWEAGRGAPDDEQLWNLAEAYGRPLAYFFTESPALPRRQDFRLQAVPKREPLDSEGRKSAIAEFEELCRAQFALEAALGRPDHSAIEQIRAESAAISDPEELAAFVRRWAGLRPGPIPDLRALLERLGVKVFVVRVADERLSGTSWWHAAYGPAMLVNRVQAEARRLFTMAHELGHLLRLDSHAFCDYLDLQVREERFANQFAAALLMPEDDMKRFVQPMLETEELGGWGTSDETLDKVGRHYKTSREAVAWRLENLGLLPQGFTDTRRPEWSRRRFFRGPKGERWRHRVKHLGKTYTSMVKEAYGKGLLSLSTAADMLGVDVAHADEWLHAKDNG
jgi:Zn-dependent peptidase ImmA (M78 family)/transcriptional regulator with XRE-family HTH domain